MKNNIIIESWKDIKGYEGLYQISNLGRIKSFKTSKSGKYMTPKNDSRGYLQIQLSNNDKVKKNFKIHRLVAQAFIPNPDNKPCIDHINTIRDDNRVENLRWVTHKENSNNELSIEHYKNVESHHNKHTQEQINKIKETKARNRSNGIRCKGKTVICLTTGDIFKSAILAAEHFNIRSSEIIACCKGKRKSCGKIENQKLIWRYIEGNKVIEPEKTYKFKIELTSLEKEILIEKKLVEENGIEKYIKYLIEEDINK